MDDKHKLDEARLIVYRLARLLRQRDGENHPLQAQLERALDLLEDLGGAVRADDPYQVRDLGDLDPYAEAETEEDMAELFDEPEDEDGNIPGFDDPIDPDEPPGGGGGPGVREPRRPVDPNLAPGTALEEPTA
jgi:hypothetical protein